MVNPVRETRLGHPRRRCRRTRVKSGGPGGRRSRCEGPWVLHHQPSLLVSPPEHKPVRPVPVGSPLPHKRNTCGYTHTPTRARVCTSMYLYVHVRVAHTSPQTHTRAPTPGLLLVGDSGREERCPRLLARAHDAGGRRRGEDPLPRDPKTQTPEGPRDTVPLRPHVRPFSTRHSGPTEDHHR